MSNNSRSEQDGRRNRPLFSHSCFVIRHLLCGALILLFVQTLFAAEVIPPAPPRYFNDNAQLVSVSDADRFNAQLEQFEKDSSNQIVVVIYPKMETQTSIEDYAQQLFRAWKIGQKSHDNGVLLLVFVQDHKLRIQTGYGLEGALPDITCRMIEDNDIAARFKQNDYSGGLSAGINAMIAATRGEYKGTGATHQGGNSSAVGFVFILFILFVVFNFFMVRRYGWSFLFNEAGWILSSMGSGSSRGGGGGGGGGFSGGGGSSGGGGASGSW